jgi:hypothetical protein
MAYVRAQFVHLSQVLGLVTDRWPHVGWIPQRTNKSVWSNSNVAPLTRVLGRIFVARIHHIELFFAQAASTGMDFGFFEREH